MKGYWAREKGNKIPVPVWWLECLAEHIEKPEMNYMLRENARAIRRQLAMHKKFEKLKARTAPPPVR